MGLLKTPVFGALIALIASHNGMRTAGVGRSTTRAVVTSVISIMIANHFLTKVVIELWTLALSA